jgi:cation-dependent mannose-6-phosphate receptor
VSSGYVHSNKSSNSRQQRPSTDHHSIRLYLVAPAGALFSAFICHLTMHFPALPTALLLTLSLHSGVHAAASDDKKTTPLEPCTVASSAGSFYDLRSLRILPPTDDKKKAKGAKTDDWHVRGWDYHDGKANFTLNICAPVVDPIDSADGISHDLQKNISAYYTVGSDTFSIG